MVVAEADELLERFFSQFAATVKLRGGKPGDRLARALSRYGRVAAPLTVIPGVGIPVEGSRRLALGGAALLRAGTSLHQRREALERALGALDRQVLVVVDDLDRLRSRREIAEMVRLIRLVGDLPRVTYLIAYERHAITTALGDGDELLGQTYLEKIVQAVFELPPIRRDLLERILGDAVEQAVGDVSGLRFSRERLTTLQIAGLFRLFGNLRDVRRFASALPAVVTAVGDEVELADVLAVEALRLLEPRAFALIAANVDVLTGHQGDLIKAVRQRDEDPKQRLGLIFEHAVRRDIVRDLVRELFPAAGRHLGGSNFSPGFQGVWRRERLVAHRDVFVTYLERGLPADTLPAHVVEDALGRLDDREALGRSLSQLTDARFQQLLARLEDYEGRFKLTHPEVAIEVLTMAALRLYPDPAAGLGYDPHAAVKRLVLRILRTRAAPEVEAIVDRTTLPNLSARADFIYLVGHEADAGHGLVSAERARSLEQDVVDAILDAPVEELRQERDLGHLIWRAEQLEPERTSARLGELIGDRVFLIRWLAQAMYEKRGSGRLTRLLPWARLTERLGEARLIQAIGELDEAWVADRGDDRELQAFRQALHYSQHPDRAEADLEVFQGFSSELEV